MKRELTAQEQLTADRLLDLADLLDRVPPRKFDMESWLRDIPMRGKKVDPLREEECGTAACALGWATTLPWARKLGARFIDFSLGSEGMAEHAEIRTRKSRCIGAVILEFFPLLPDDAFYPMFFGPPCTPCEKAEEIRKTVKRLFGVQRGG